MSLELKPEEIGLLQQARRGAQSLAWLFVFLGLTVGMYLFIAARMTGPLYQFGGVLVCLLTAWVCMLFLGGVSKVLCNALLVALSPRQRALRDWERGQS